MTWHLEITSMTARRYLPGESYDQKSKFASALQVQLMDGGKRAFLSAASNNDARGKITKQDWLELRALLHSVGVDLIETSRHGEGKDYDTGPAPLT